MSFYVRYPLPVSEGIVDLPAPTSATLVGGMSPTGTLVPIQMDDNGGVVVSLAAGLSVLLSQEISAGLIPSSSSAPFQITLSLPSAAKQIMIYDTTGQTMQIRTGAATGTLLFLTGPGQDTPMPVAIPQNTRVTIRSNGAAPTAGSYIITILG